MSPSWEVREDVSALVNDSNLKARSFNIKASEPLNIILLPEVKVGVPVPF